MERIVPEIYSVLFLGSIQGIVLGFILLARRKGGKAANAILAAILFFFSISISIHSITHITYVPYITENHEFFMIIGLMNLGPLYYSYVRSLIDPGFNAKKFFTRISPLYFMMAILIACYLLWNETLARGFAKEIALIINIIVSTVFIFLSVFSIYRYTVQIRNSFSNLEKINLKWLKFLGFCFVFFLLANIVIRFVLNNSEQGDVIWFVSSVIIFIIGYFSLAKPEIFITVETTQNKESFIKESRKYKKSALTADIAGIYLQKLNTIMETEKLYMNSNLTLPGLAEKTGIPTNLLSQVINESIGQNFYDYINSQRINEAIGRLTDPSCSDYNISAIAFDAGFNTLSSFNSSFKKYTGMTPSQYKKTSSLADKC